jgi:hypothetical protein
MQENDRRDDVGDAPANAVAPPIDDLRFMSFASAIKRTGR